MSKVKDWLFNYPHKTFEFKIRKWRIVLGYYVNKEGKYKKVLKVENIEHELELATLKIQIEGLNTSLGRMKSNNAIRESKLRKIYPFLFKDKLQGFHSKLNSSYPKDLYIGVLESEMEIINEEPENE